MNERPEYIRLMANIGDIDGATVAYSPEYKGPIPMVGDVFVSFVYDRDIEYYGRPDDEWPDDPGEKRLRFWKVIGRQFDMTSNRWSQGNADCLHVTLFVEETKGGGK